MSRPDLGWQPTLENRGPWPWACRGGSADSDELALMADGGSGEGALELVRDMILRVQGGRASSKMAPHGGAGRAKRNGDDGVVQWSLVALEWLTRIVALVQSSQW
jgi:hypothetical protein